VTDSRFLAVSQLSTSTGLNRQRVFYIMRAKLIHHAPEWLPGDFEAPSQLSDKKFLIVWHLRQDPKTGWTAMKVNRGAGVWDDSGRLRLYCERAGDIDWSKDSTDMYILENRFGACRQGKGVAHTLKRLDSTGLHTLTEIEVCVPMGGVEYLVKNHTGDICLTTWLDQTQWGYCVVDLRTMIQLSGELYFPVASLAPPAFSLDDAHVVACSRFKNGWWTDVVDDYWDRPSPGGVRKLGTLSVHKLASNAVTYHDVMVELPKGWIPDRAQEAEWSMLWGPEFVSAREFKIWLPDDSMLTLDLPLPPRIHVGRPLETRRTWLD
jgi:hypothetical protein